MILSRLGSLSSLTVRYLWCSWRVRFGRRVVCLWNSGVVNTAGFPTMTDDYRWTTTGCVDEALAEDYASMLAIGMLLDEDEPFGTLMQRCALIEKRAMTMTEKQMRIARPTSPESSAIHSMKSKQSGLSWLMSTRMLGMDAHYSANLFRTPTMPSARRLTLTVLEGGWRDAQNSLLRGPALLVANDGPFPTERS